MSGRLKLHVIDGPNLGALGHREPSIYGTDTLEDIREMLRNKFHSIEFTFIQSNIEGELIDKLYHADEVADGVIVNPGGYSHTSVALADAISSVKLKVIEVHLSNLHAREEYRHNSLTGARCAGVISGFGPESYLLAAQWFLR